MPDKFYKERFEAIPKVKQDQILNAAIEEFAVNGFNGTSINNVAKRAQISIGALYSYFDSKDDLFLTIIETLHDKLAEALSVIDLNMDFFDVLRQLYKVTYEYANNYTEMNQIYLDMSTQSLTHLTERLTKPLEVMTKEFYINLISMAKANGQIRNDISVEMLGYILDNMGITFQFSHTSDYYKERMKLYLGDTEFLTIDSQIDELVRFIKNAVT